MDSSGQHMGFFGSYFLSYYDFSLYQYYVLFSFLKGRSDIFIWKGEVF